MDYIGCDEQLNYTIISVSEKKMKFTINNPNSHNVTKVRVDNCLITGNQERCDYLFEITNPSLKVIYVELKGSDIDKACSQLSSTLRLCMTDHSHHEKSCFIVASRVPRHGPKIQVTKAKFYQQNRVILKVHTQQVTINI